jgi:hypothetical protein
MSGGGTKPGVAIDPALTALSLQLDGFIERFDKFNSYAFAADSLYHPGQRSLAGWTKALTDSLSEVLNTLEEGLQKVITGESLAPDERISVLKAIEDYTRIQALHPIAKAAKKPPIGFSTDTVQVEIPDLNFAPLIARLDTKGRFQTTALV